MDEDSTRQKGLPVAASDCGETIRAREFAFAFAALFSTLFSLVMAGLILYCRRGLYVPPGLAALCVCLFPAAAFAPFLLPRERWKAPWLRPLAPLAMLASPLVALAPGFPGGTLVYLYAAAALAGIWRSRAAWKSFSAGQWAFLAASILFAAYVFFYFNSWNYSGVFAPEQALLGQLRKDTYFHAAVAQMIGRFHVSSTGLDGLVPLHYHVGSHLWFAALGLAAATPPLLAYPFIHMIVLLPALFLAISLSLIGVSRGRTPPAAAPAWAMAFLFIGDAIGRPSHYVSESYAASLAAMLLFWPLLVDIASRPNPERGRDFARTSASLAAVFLLTSLKISVGLLWAGSLGWVVWRRWGFRPHGLAILALVGIIGCGSFLIFYDPAFGAEIEPLNFISRAPLLLMLGNLLIPGLLLAACIFNDRIYKWPDLVNAFLQKRVLGAEVIFLMTAAAAAPALFLRIPITSAWFFGNVPQWPALSLLAAIWYASRPVPRAWKRAVIAVSIAAVSLGTVVSLGRVLPLAGSGYLAKGLRFTRARTAEGANAASPVRPYGRKLDAILGETAGYQAYVKIMEAAQGQGEDFAVWVPASNKKFWSITRNCQSQPLFAPAVAGRPMLYGLLPPDIDCDLSYYGYPDYGGHAFARDLEDTDICRHARKKGFRRVFVLASLEASAPNRVLDCADLIKK